MLDYEKIRKKQETGLVGQSSLNWGEIRSKIDFSKDREAEIEKQKTKQWEKEVNAKAEKARAEKNAKAASKRRQVTDKRGEDTNE